MPELCSEDEEDPLNEDKFRRSQECKARARVEALQRLVPLLSPPKPAPESQAKNITDTPEAESDPAEAHELTGEGTTNATDPTTSDGVVRETATLITMSWRQCTVAPPCARMTGTRVSSRQGLQNITQC